VKLAERAHGPIPRPVDFAYVWGAALEALDVMRPAARIINLETSITVSEDNAPKDINYRMHPGNVGVFTQAGIDCCTLANNHILDWGEAGLRETLTTLASANIAVAGAGADLNEAQIPAALSLADGYTLSVFACGAANSGVPASWGAADKHAGVWQLAELSDRSVDSIARVIEANRKPDSIVMLSIHWGGNWGYEIPDEQREFAHALIDRAAVDLIYGHSAHHPKAIEVYRNKLILYGSGDFIDDYEGIQGHEQYRADLVLMYFPMLDANSGELNRLEMLPLRLCNFRLNHPARADRLWLARVLDRECSRFGAHVRLYDDVFVLE
jgi:poly-gamma-glutamate synthesis protein (capsule biosynthesis protein)